MKRKFKTENLPDDETCRKMAELTHLAFRNIVTNVCDLAIINKLSMRNVDHIFVMLALELISGTVIRRPKEVGDELLKEFIKSFKEEVALKRKKK